VSVSNLISSFGELEVATLAEVGALFALAVGLARITDDGMQAALGFKQFTMHTGENAQALQKWQIVAEQSHASAEEVAQGFESMAKHLANLALTGQDPALKSLQMLGIDPYDAYGRLKKVGDLATEVRHRLATVTSNPSIQESILGGLGLGPNLRETFLLSDRLFAARAATATGMSARQERDLDRLRQLLQEIKLEARDIGIAIGGWVSPELTTWIKWVRAVFHELAGLSRAMGLPIVGKDVRAFAGAEHAVAGDFLNVLAGKPLDVGDLAKQSKVFEGLGGDLIRAFIEKDFFPAPGNLPPASGSGRGGVTIQRQDIHVHGVNDPEAVADAVDKHFREKVVDPFDQQQLLGGY
jgi:hypothetical protein